MRVTVCASGATGRHLIDQALAQGHHVTAFVRNASRLGGRSEQPSVVVGDVAEPASVASAVDGRHAVLCALGAASPLRRDPTLVDGVRHIVAAMEQHGVRRLVYLSFLGVPEGRHQLSVVGRYLIAPLLLRNVVADHAAKERIIRRSTLEWVSTATAADERRAMPKLPKWHGRSRDVGRPSHFSGRSCRVHASPAW